MKGWSTVKNDRIWIPTIMTLPIGMLYPMNIVVPNDEEDKVMKWGFAKMIDIAEEDRNIWNSKAWYIPVEKNVLVLFPSWLEHSVEENKKQTTDRISISFNTFTKGRFGSNEQSNELIL